MGSIETEKELQRQLKLQLEAVKNAEKLNEQPAKRPPVKDRFSLVFQFECSLKSIENEKYNLRQSIITGKRHYCKKHLSELKPIRLNEMMVPKIHFDRYLICRTITTPSCIVGMMVVIEDLNGDVEELSLYNLTKNLKLNTEDLIPPGTILAIKEPYMKYGSLGNNTCIRCDSPSDVIFLDESNELLKNTRWHVQYMQKQFEEFKVHGNRLFHIGKYDQSLRWYTKASVVDPKSPIIHLNLAAVLLKLERYEEAYKHAKLSNDLKPLDKAQFRMAVSAYRMRNWTLSLGHYKSMMANIPVDVDHKNSGIQKCEARLKESQTGSYNWANMINETNSVKNPRLDYADYKGPVEVANVDGKGKGLITTRDVKQGELLLVAKAFSTSYQSELDNLMIISSNSITKKLDRDTQVLNVINTIQNLKNNPSKAKEVYSLFNGDLNRENVEIPEGCIDTGRIEQICSFNTFSAQNMESIIGMENELAKDIEGKATGLWLLPSYINHACYNNASRTFYGDFMVVHAIRSIKKGDETTVPYVDPLTPLKQRQEICSHYKFKCKCELCEMDAHDDQYAERESLIKDKLDKANEFLKLNPKKAIKLGLKLVTDLKQLYKKRDKLKYQLVRPMSLLAFAYISNGDLTNTISVMEEIICVLDGQIDHMCIVALIKIALLQFKMGNSDLAVSSLRKAFEKSKTMNGDTIESFKLRNKNMLIESSGILDLI